jgi:exo-beta-1,3-glucanase (GH17 family)
LTSGYTGSFLHLFEEPSSEKHEILKMHFSSIITAAVLAGPVAVAARGTLGFAVGNTTPDNKCKKTSDYKNDFDAIKANSEATLIRTYSNTDQFGNPCDTADQILPAAKEAGLKVLVGMWYVSQSPGHLLYLTCMT